MSRGVGHASEEPGVAGVARTEGSSAAAGRGGGRRAGPSEGRQAAGLLLPPERG